MREHLTSIWYKSKSIVEITLPTVRIILVRLYLCLPVCLSVGRSIRPSIYKYPSFVHISFPSLNAPWKVLESVFFCYSPTKTLGLTFFFYLLLTTAFVLVVNYVPARGRTDGRVDGRTGGSVWHFFARACKVCMRLGTCQAVSGDGVVCIHFFLGI